MKHWIAFVFTVAGLTAQTPAPREVLAFYYDWYGNPDISGRWLHWPEGYTHTPALGRYDSRDPKLVAAHMRQAKQAGITGLIATWWSKGDVHDQAMPLILTEAEKAGIKITAYFETVPPRNAPTVEGAVETILYILERYGGHPAWLKAEGRPVLFIYGRAVGQLKLPGWSTVIAAVKQKHPAVFIGDQISDAATSVFDGIHTYNPTGRLAGKSLEEIRAWAGKTYPEWVRTAKDKISCVTIIPGYDDSKLSRPKPRPITDRYDGRTYRGLWEAAIAARPRWILITSWNEWHEGSEIEPSVENGDRELKTTAEFAPKFLR